MSSMPTAKRLKDSPCTKSMDQPAVEDSGVQLTENNLLPSDSPIWANILNCLYLDEVLQCIVASRSFHRDIPALIEILLVRKSENLKLPAVARFTSAREVYVYSLIQERGPDHGKTHKEAWQSIMASSEVPVSMATAFMQARRENPAPEFHMDATTLEHILPFLCQLPSLEFCFVGGLCKCEEQDHVGWRKDTRCDISYNVQDAYDIEDSTAKFAGLVERVCRAYASGELSDKVVFMGIISDQRCKYTGRTCTWNNLPKIRTHRDDVPCQLCDLICMSFPLKRVMTLTDAQIPCISQQNRLNIAMGRDPKACRSNLTELWCTELKRAGGMPVLYPPDFTKHGFAVCFDEESIEKMEWLLSTGADAKDPRLRKVLVERSDTEEDDNAIGWDYHGIYDKRLICKASFQDLKRLGLDVSETDFHIMDTSDIRLIPSYNRAAFRARQGREDSESSGAEDSE